MTACPSCGGMGVAAGAGAGVAAADGAAAGEAGPAAGCGEAAIAADGEAAVAGGEATAAGFGEAMARNCRRSLAPGFVVKRGRVELTKGSKMEGGQRGKEGFWGRRRKVRPPLDCRRPTNHSRG